MKKGINKTIMIDGIEVPMRASAASPRIYRTVFGRDMLVELQELRDAKERGERFDLAILENMAYLFAYQANNDIDDIDTWLDQFGFTAIYEAGLDILSLWSDNETATSTAKK